MDTATKLEGELLAHAKMKLWPLLNEAGSKIEAAEACLSAIDRMDWVDGIELARVEDAARKILASAERMRESNASELTEARER